MKAVLAMFVMLGSLNVYALEAGAYQGKITGTKNKVQLMLREAVGREGSFLGLLKSKEELALYVLDKAAPGSSTYVMTPFEVLGDGDVGIRDDDPSLVLMMLPNDGDKIQFNISNSNSGNSIGFQNAMMFSGKTTKVEWIDSIAGAYKYDCRKCDALILSGFNSISGESQGIFATENISGSFAISEECPGKYSVKAKRFLATGENDADAPMRIGVFVKEGRDYDFLLANPGKYSDIQKFELKD